MNYMDADETHGDKDNWKLHKNAMCCFEQILEATPHKTAVVRSPISHLRNHLN